MYISIIIVNYNTKDLLINCLDSIYNSCNSNNFEIIVVDNNSSDGSKEMLKKYFNDKIIIIKNRNNAGFGRANNQAAKLAKGEYLFFLNSDTVIKEDILTPATNYLNDNKKLGVISPRLLLESGKEQEYAYGDFPNLFSTIFNKFFKKQIKCSEPFEVDWVTGAALIIKKDVYNQLNGFDDKFFMYFEDIDLCKRVKDLGYRVVVNPQIELIHLCGKSINIIKKRKRYYYQSQDYYFKKHFGILSMLLTKLLRLPYQLFKST